jgi:phospholipid transport system substrate-binding protein
MKRLITALSASLLFSLGALPSARSADLVVAKTAPAEAKSAPKKAAKASPKTSAKKATDTKKTPANTVPEEEDLSTGAPTLPPPGSSPIADLKKSDQALKKLFHRSAPSWSPEQDAKRSEMRKIVASFLDYQELAHRALAKHWDSLDPAARKEFVSVLRDLIERNYIRQVHGKANYDLNFDKEVIEGSNASVTATLKTTANGKKVVVEMEYKLLHKGNRWLVFDLVTDEQSMLENYRAEFGKVINKEGFDTLLKRMKKRLEKMD